MGMKRTAFRERKYKGRGFWSNPLQLLIAAAILHLALTALIFGIGKQASMPATFDANGTAVSFANDGVGYRQDAATLAEMLSSRKFHEWSSAAYPFHVKLYSICFASLGSILGFNILSAEPLNLFCYLGILVFVYKLSHQIFGSVRAALIAAGVVALWPTFSLHTTQLLKDPLFIAGMLALIFIMVQLLLRPGSWSMSLLRGALGALLAAGLFKERFDLAPLLIATVLLGGLMLLIRQFQLRRAWPANLAGIALLTILMVAALLWLPVYRGADHPRIEEAGSKPSNLKPKARVSWWQVPAKIGIVRERFAEKYNNAGSNIDSYVKLTSTADLIRYLPRAVAIGLFAPFPNMWFETGSSVGLLGRILAGLETLIMYAIEFLAVVEVWRRRRNLSVWLLFSIAAAGITALGFVVVNVGTLYRLRYLYLILLIIPAASAIEYFLDQFMKSRKSYPVSEPLVRST
ncbi:MAG: hypothetical protein QOF62_1861 [Pyrinomonadaceae bacterium]|jgi:hypothetical protein|nr:hypothetical protein [Pyrinomonadaceae bacterium]